MGIAAGTEGSWEIEVKPPAPVHLHVVTANIQSMKDATTSIFNPTGHTARRQYLMEQARKSGITFSAFRRLADGYHGGHGPERAIRMRNFGSAPTSSRHPHSFNQDWRILVSTPRLLVVTCLAEGLPLTVCAPYAVA